MLKLIDNDNRITVDFRFISSYILDCLLYVSDVVLIPYHTETCINSGVMIHAFSAGKPVIMPNICSAMDYNDDFIYIVDDNNIKPAMFDAYKNGKEINYQLGQNAFKKIHEYNSLDVVEKRLIKMIEE